MYKKTSVECDQSQMFRIYQISSLKSRIALQVERKIASYTVTLHALNHSAFYSPRDVVTWLPDLVSKVAKHSPFVFFV